MDVQMPEMDGLDATRAIRELAGGEYAANVEGLPVLAMTAATFEEDRRNCLQAGMDDFVAKPVNPRSLFAAMNEWFEGKM
jgi:CheY-like chemotaxis protein